MLNGMTTFCARRVRPAKKYTSFVTLIMVGLFIFLTAASVAGQPAAGTLLDASKSGGSVPVSGFTALPPAFASELAALRDGVYNTADPQEILKKGLLLLANLPPRETELAASRIEYFIARSFKDHGDKKNAVIHFEAALEYAKKSMPESSSSGALNSPLGVPPPGAPSGETAEGLMALTRALSELCLLKDMAFLISNGPKISQYTKKILALDPHHVGALITTAAAKAYPPPLFGGNPKQAIIELTSLIKSRPEGFTRDDLFDIRVCMGTAAERLGQKADAIYWFSKALELYPTNNYAREELEKLKP